MSLCREEDNMNFAKEDFLKMHHIKEDDLDKSEISWETLTDLYLDFNNYKDTYHTPS